MYIPLNGVKTKPMCCKMQRKERELHWTINAPIKPAGCHVKSQNKHIYWWQWVFFLYFNNYLLKSAKGRGCKREIKIENRLCVPHTRRSKTKPARSSAHTMGRAYTATRKEDNARFFFFFGFYFYFTLRAKEKLKLRTGRVSHTPAARKLNQHGAQPTPWGERI